MTWRRPSARRPFEEQLDKEVRFHLEEHVAELIAAGVPLEEARRRARAAFGGAEAVKESCRDARGARWLADLAQDLRYGLRLLRRKPAFTAVVLATLALGIGATTLMFTLVSGVLLKPLAFAHPERLVELWERTAEAPNATAKAEGWGQLWAFAFPNYLDLLHQSRMLDLAASRYNGGIVSEPGHAGYADAYELTANYFSVIGVKPFLGRDFLPEEDRLGAAPVAIISDSLWQQRFGASPRALGSRMDFGGSLYTVVGVMPRGFDLAGYTTADAADVYTLIGQDPSPLLRNRRAHPGIHVLARLRPGVALVQAQKETEVIARRLQAHYPVANAARDFLLQPLQVDVGDARTTLWLLLVAVALVLLIACVNIAGLLLARAVSRERELAMRAALGAGRFRLVRQCLAESALLGVGGGALGVWLAAAGVHPFLRLWPGGLPRAGDVHLDGRVLLFALVVSLASGVLFGLAPAWRVPLRQVDAALRDGVRTQPGGTRRLHGAFVVAEVALAIVLLVAAGIMGGALVRLSSLDLGVNTRDVLTARVALPPSAFSDTARLRAEWRALLQRVRALPGVQAAAIVDTVPLREGNNPSNYWTGSQEPPEDQQPTAMFTAVSDDYFKVMGIRLLRGRGIDERDRMGTLPVAVIDSVLARHAFPGHDPVGRHINLGFGDDPCTIVGVVGHVRYWGPAADDESPVRDQVYYSFAQLPDRYVPHWSQLMSIAVRTAVPPLTLLGELRQAVRAAGGDRALYEVYTMEQLAHGALDQQRFLLLLFGIFSALALLLACLGVYGVQGYLVAQRVPEIGVRMALGATRDDVLWMVLRQSLGTVLIGVAIGGAASVAVGRELHSLVGGLGGAAPQTLVVMSLLLLLAAAGASLPAALRASRVDPMLALRQE